MSSASVSFSTTMIVAVEGSRPASKLSTFVLVSYVPNVVSETSAPTILVSLSTA